MFKPDAFGSGTFANRCTKLSTVIAAVRILLVVIPVLMLGGLADARTMYVNAERPTSGDGGSWARAFKYLRDALDISAPGDEIYVAKGTYYPDDGNSGYFGDRELAFQMDRVKIYGGFAGTETSPEQRDVAANPTILSGEIWDSVDTPDPELYWSLHVVVLDGSSSLDGLTIERGRANGRTTFYNQGGGVYVKSGTLTLVNCVIRECLAEQDGGAVFGNVVATGCTFSGNRADNERQAINKLLADPSVYDQYPDPKHSWLFNTTSTGGAIAGNVTATDCKFLDNHVRARCVSAGFTSAAFGGAIAGTVIARDCVFDGNTSNSTSYYAGASNAFATARGGAIMGTSTLVNCILTKNRAVSRAKAWVTPKPPTYTAYPHSFGGATSGKLGAMNCVFADNSISSYFLGGDFNNSQSWGGAVYVLDKSDILNCVFVRNDLTGDFAGGGGGIRANPTSELPIMNCTFLDNTTNLSGTCLSVGGNVKALSNIFWSSAPEGTPETLIFVDEYGYNKDAFATISNRLYPTPSTETTNIVRGIIDINGANTGVSTYNADHDLGDQKRTLPIVDPLFADIANPEGVDGIWGTADDGLRLTAPMPDTTRRAIGQGHPLFLPTDKFDLDEDGNTTETIPVDIGNYVRMQLNPLPAPESPDRQSFYRSDMDLGAYEFGDISLFPEIEVEQPAGAVLVDDANTVTLAASPGVPAVRTFVIKNIGAMPLKQLSVTKSGADANEFVISQPLVNKLGAAGSTTFTVTFAAKTAGLRTARIHIASNDKDENPFDVNLQGLLQVPDIAVEYPTGTGLTDNVSTVNYGTVGVLASSAKTFTIRNTGLGDLKITSIALSGANAADFKVVSSAAVIFPGGEAQMKVTFAPSAAGARNAALTILSNDPDAESSFVIKLSGNGITSPEIAVHQPASKSLLDGSSKSFGSVKKGLSYTKAFTVKNVGTSALKNISVSMRGSADFTKTKLAVTSLKPGESAVFSVTFKPSSLGGKSANLKIVSNDADENPFDIALSGTGISVKSSSPAKRGSASPLAAAGRDASSEGIVTELKAADGLKYLVLTVDKAAGWSTAAPTVQVSSNLVDWFSGSKHTTTLVDDSKILRVRDNTPVTSGGKRYIRLK